MGEALKRELSDGELPLSQFDQTVEHGRHMKYAQETCKNVVEAWKTAEKPIETMSRVREGQLRLTAASRSLSRVEVP